MPGITKSQLCGTDLPGMGFAQCFPTPPIQSLTLPSPASVQLAINSFILILKVAHSSWTLLSHRQRGIGLSQRAPGRFLGGNSSGAGSHPLLDASPPRSRGFMVREWVWSVML